MTRLMIAGGIYLLLLALIIISNHGAHRHCFFTQVFQSHPIPGWLFYCPLTRGGKERM